MQDTLGTDNLRWLFDTGRCTYSEYEKYSTPDENGLANYGKIKEFVANRLTIPQGTCAGITDEEAERIADEIFRKKQIQNETIKSNSDYRM